MKAIGKKEFIEKLEQHTLWLKEKKGEKLTLFSQVLAFDIDSIFLEEHNISLEEISFSNCYFYGVMLNEVNLKKVSFDNCSFKDAVFHRVDLEESHFEKIQGNKISILGSNVKDAIFKDIRLTSIQLEMLTSVQTERVEFINCHFNKDSHIKDCTFHLSSFTQISMDDSFLINNTSFFDCIFDNKETQSAIQDHGGIISYTNYELMKWEIITDDELHTSYVYTFFAGFKELLTKKYNDLIIEWEHTNKPSIVLHIKVKEKALLANLIINVQHSISQYFENILKTQKDILTSKIIGKDQNTLHDVMYKFFGSKKAIENMIIGNIKNNVVDFEGNEIDIKPIILNISEINLIIGDHNIIGDNNTQKSLLTF